MTDVYPLFCRLKNFIRLNAAVFIKNTYLQLSACIKYHRVLIELCLQDDNQNAFEQFYNQL